MKAYLGIGYRESGIVLLPQAAGMGEFSFMLFILTTISRLEKDGVEFQIMSHPTKGVLNLFTQINNIIQQVTHKVQAKNNPSQLPGEKVELLPGISQLHGLYFLNCLLILFIFVYSSHLREANTSHCFSQLCIVTTLKSCVSHYLTSLVSDCLMSSEFLKHSIFISVENFFLA